MTCFFRSKFYVIIHWDHETKENHAHCGEEGFLETEGTRVSNEHDRFIYPLRKQKVDSCLLLFHVLSRNSQLQILKHGKALLYISFSSQSSFFSVSCLNISSQVLRGFGYKMLGSAVLAYYFIWCFRMCASWCSNIGVQLWTNPIKVWRWWLSYATSFLSRYIVTSIVYLLALISLPNIY